ncbi:MAG TPA: hypothetical protein PKA90_12230 [Ignavibacteria bacterium]|nr:hypothetical protein [Ignavibacteria bacterium]HMR41188.1 hypothetical protein [Ignavibacteria bacterium]
METKEYFITKLLFNEDKKLIKDVFAYEYDGHSLSEGTDHMRHWMVNRVNEGSQISIITPNSNDKDKWIRGNPLLTTMDFFLGEWNYL